MNRQDLMDRLLDLGARSVRLSANLPRTDGGRHVALQMVRAATSAGANYSEACGAESRKDFSHKLQIVIKELRETYHWLRLIARAEIVKTGRLERITGDVNEVIAILVSSVNTLKRSPQPDAQQRAIFDRKAQVTRESNIANRRSQLEYRKLQTADRTSQIRA